MATIDCSNTHYTRHRSTKRKRQHLFKNENLKQTKKDGDILVLIGTLFRIIF